MVKVRNDEGAWEVPRAAGKNVQVDGGSTRHDLEAESTAIGMSPHGKAGPHFHIPVWGGWATSPSDDKISSGSDPGHWTGTRGLCGLVQPGPGPPVASLGSLSMGSQLRRAIVSTVYWSWLATSCTGRQHFWM